MRQFFDFMIAFYVEGNVHPEIVGDPGSVTIRIDHAIGTFKRVLSDRQCNRPSRIINHIEREIYTSRKLVVTDKIQRMWFIETAGIINSFVNDLATVSSRRLHERA